jgi:hypothetical protein
MKKALFLLITFTALTSCNTIKYINIETYKPAEITFPTRVSKVLIVNNAVPQPEQSGYEYKLMGIAQDTARAKADSALFDAGHALGIAILETNYFNDVLLFHENTRKDEKYLTDEKLTQVTVQALCEETGADAVISIDRLLFDMSKATASLSNNLFLGFINVKIASVMRAYIPERESPLATVLMSDSIYWNEQGETIKELDKYLPSPEEALRESAKYIANLAAPNFVPHWNNEVRWFYSGISTEWKQASAYASTQKWDEAKQLWHSAYNRTNNETSKAKLASNLAFVEEMLGNYAEALEWAEKARLSFQKKGENTRDYQLVDQYAKALQERIKENLKLNIQFGES